MSGDVVPSVDGAGVRARLTASVGGQRVDVIVDGDLVFFRQPAMPDDAWITADVDDPLAQQATLGAAELTGWADSEEMRALAGAVTSVTDSGKSLRIDGVEARRYDVSVDTASLAEDLGGVRTTLESSYWVGPDGLPRMVTTTSPDGSTFTTRLSAWGDDVAIEIPEVEQAVDIADVPGLGS